MKIFKFLFIIFLLPIVGMAQVSLEEGLVGHYPFSNHSLDVSVNQNDAIVHSATTITDRFGNFVGAYFFNGTDAYMDMSVSPFLNDDYSYSLWAKIAALPETGEVASLFLVGTSEGWQAVQLVNQVNGDTGFRVGGSTVGSNMALLVADNLPETEHWYHVLVTHGDGQLKLYINGVQASSTLTVGNANYGTDNQVVRIACNYNQMDFFNGSLDEIRIYDRALRSEEVEALYFGTGDQPTVQDCLGAIPICNETYEEPEPYQYSGEGNYPNEIDKYTSCITSEANGLWYIFKPQTDGALKFTIESHRDTDDYDWIVFDITNGTCDDITDHTSEYTLSSNNYGSFTTNQFTGANSDRSGGSAGHCNGPGEDNGPNFNDDIPVQQGGTYVLYLSNWSGSRYGYDINFSASTASIFDGTAPALKNISSTFSDNCVSNVIQFHFTENVKCESVSTDDFTITDANGNNYPIVHVYSELCDVGAANASEFFIRLTEPLPQGSYFLNLVGQVSDACENNTNNNSLSFDIEALGISDVSYSDISCNDAQDGVIQITAGGGDAPIQYSIDGGSSYQQNSGVYADLQAGTYHIQVKDANNCVVEYGEITITNPEPVDIQDISFEVIACNNDNDGSITILATGGTGSLSYSINNGSDFVENNGVFENLTAGTYNIVVKDANGCTISGGTVQITEPDLLIAQIAAFSGISCNGNGDGNIDITTTGGTAPYTFLWSNGASSEDLENLEEGIYSLLVTDANACISEVSTEITEPEQLVANSTFSNITCFGNNNGSVDLQVSGGTSPYTFSWSNGASSEDLNNLAAGTYSVNITDSHSCTASTTVEITEPNELLVDINSSDVKCYGNNDGSITYSISGGSPAYTTTWKDSQNNVIGNLSGLAPETYTIDVLDANSCHFTQSVEITEPDELTINIEQENILCFGEGLGSISYEISGGTETYTALWTSSGGSPVSNLTSLSPDTYTVMVTDANSCTAIQTVEITEADELFISETTSEISCNGGNNGAIDLTVSGGTLPYQFVWTKTDSEGEFSNEEDLTNLFTGTYNVLISDKNGCTHNRSYTVDEPDVLKASLDITHISCSGAANGELQLNLTGGSGTYSYLWSNGAETRDISLLPPGKYYVTIIDESVAECAMAFATIEEPDILEIEITENVKSCNGKANGKIVYELRGGTPEYTVVLLNSTQVEVIDMEALLPDNYILKVIDKHQCEEEINVLVESKECKPELEIPNVFTPDNSGKNDVFFEINQTNHYINKFNAVIFSRWGKEIYSWSDFQNKPWEGKTKSGIEVSNGAYYYVIQIVGDDGKPYEYKGVVYLIR